MQIYKTPNKFTRKPLFNLDGNRAIVTGYHRYRLTRFSVEPYGNMNKINKFNLIRSIIVKEVPGKTVNDLGCANGLYSIACAYNKASRVNAVDMDRKHLQMLNKAIDFAEIKNIIRLRANIQNYVTKADITIALALIHWIYSCTAFFGDFDSIMKKLKSITNEMLILEWIEPDDPKIKMFKHLNYNNEIIKKAYNKQNFLESLENNFSSCDQVIGLTKTREIYKLKI